MSVGVLIIIAIGVYLAIDIWDVGPTSDERP